MTRGKSHSFGLSTQKEKLYIIYITHILEHIINVRTTEHTTVEKPSAIKKS